MSNLSRRNLLRGHWQQQRAVIRPPWIISESEFINKCSRCNSCIQACETKVIISGGGGFPELDFHQSECNFCGNCVQVCQEPIFDKEQRTPWHYKAEINLSCLSLKGIECRICHDSCEFSAIKFKLKAGHVAQPILNKKMCNGCGACISHCPVKAISISDSELNGE